MKLSIITVNLNNRDGLQKTIDSVVSQTFRDFEWIVIDGGSTDGSKELIEQYADHFAYWVSEPDKGIYNAMNKGIRHAKGEYLMFLNSGDTLYADNTLYRLEAECHGADIVYGNCLVKESEKEEFLIKYPNNLHLHQLIDSSICHQSTAIRKSLLDEEPYDENLRIVSDWKFFLRKALEGKTFHHVDLIVSIYDGQGISSINEELLTAEREKVIQEEVPPCIIADNEDINTMIDKIQSLSSWQIDSIRDLTHKKPIFHKITTATIRIMQFIDKVSTQKTNK